LLIESTLMQNGFVLRYRTQAVESGLPPREGVFLPCSFWLADNYAPLGRHSDEGKLLKRLLSVCNNVGLLSEEYDPVHKRLLGNFPQAFSHAALINTILNVTQRRDPAHQRSEFQSGSK
jgi:GH15 family glucan-1,4-alpha-glucosidase